MWLLLMTWLKCENVARVMCSGMLGQTLGRFVWRLCSGRLHDERKAPSLANSCAVRYGPVPYWAESSGAADLAALFAFPFTSEWICLPDRFGGSVLLWANAILKRHNSGLVIYLPYLYFVGILYVLTIQLRLLAFYWGV